MKTRNFISRALVLSMLLCLTLAFPMRANAFVNLYISSSPYFAPVYAGYDQPAAQDIVVGNSGDEAAPNASVTISGSDADKFEFSDMGPDTIPPIGGSLTLGTIRPIAGLPAGDYTATITASSPPIGLIDHRHNNLHGQTSANKCGYCKL